MPDFFVPAKVFANSTAFLHSRKTNFDPNLEVTKLLGLFLRGVFAGSGFLVVLYLLSCL